MQAEIDEATGVITAEGDMQADADWLELIQSALVDKTDLDIFVGDRLYRATPVGVQVPPGAGPATWSARLADARYIRSIP